MGKTRDKKYLMLEIESKDTTEFRYLRAGSAADEFRGLPAAREEAPLLRRPPRRPVLHPHQQGRHEFRHHDRAGEPTPRREELEGLPRRTSDDVRIEGIDLFQDFAVAVEKSQALNRLRVHDFKTGTWTAIAFPEPVYSVFPGGTPEYESTDLPLQLPEPGHAVERLRLRYPDRQVHAAETAGSAWAATTRRSMPPSACGPRRATA